MSGTVIKQCRCTDGPSAQYQDKTYGKGLRLHNVMEKGGAKCTVCGAINR